MPNLTAPAAYSATCKHNNRLIFCEECKNERAAVTLESENAKLKEALEIAQDALKYVESGIGDSYQMVMQSREALERIEKVLG